MPTIISSDVARLKYPAVPGWKTPNGSPVRDNGDQVAVALRGASLDDWLEIADKNDCRSNLDALIAAGKNTGQVRMALGRILRAKVARHQTDPEANEMPYLPEPKTVPVKKAGPVTPPKSEDEGEASEPESDDEEEGDDEEEEGDKSAE